MVDRIDGVSCHRCSRYVGSDFIQRQRLRRLAGVERRY